MGRFRNYFFNWLIKKRTTFGWIFFIIIAIFGKGNLRNIIFGLPFIIVGEFFRFLSSGIIKKNEILTKEGLYSLCRNPLYFGSFLVSFGFAISSCSLFVWAYFIIFFPLIYIPTIKNEEIFLENKFGEEFKKYKKEVPSFFPVFKKVNIFKGFSLKKFKENQEIINIFGILTLIGILLVKSYYEL
ncbi:MAG: isoprenylcysteine carboxylmethyltransferase family protein [Candidatus Omnitrophica bacterium]|nr:isoprenylcysteine carboxylmethyltransferase family protein [Candidatus Omnitrophota bacterium]